VHMSRVFGFRKKDYDKKSGALVDAAKISSENEYRYAQYLTSVLADEFGMSPNQMQATLWFYAKQNLSPLKDKGGGRAGTLESARDYSKDEIDVIQGMVDDGSFDKSSPLTEALSSGVRPRNKPVQKTTPFSNVEEREQLLDVVRARSPRIIASAVAGKDRGLAFPDDTPIETLIKYNQDVMQAITDDGGQIPILREMGIPHEIEEAAGSFTGYEPAMTIRFLGSDLDTVNKFAPLLGDALLQDAVITSQMVYKEDGLLTFAVTKLDESEFSREESMALTETLNPEKDPNGINFNQKLPNTLIFLDPRSLDDSVIYEDSMADDFFGTLQTQLGDSYQIDVGSSKGNYYGSDQYQKVLREAWNKDVASGSPTIYDRTRDSLYEPVRKVYNRYAKELGIPQRESQGLADDQLNAPPRRPSDTDFVTAPTSTAAEIMSDDDLIASVRTGTTSGGESGIPSSGIKKWLQKNFSSRGLLPETAFDSMIQRDGEFGAVELDIRQMVGIYDNAVVENFGNIDGQQRAVLDDAMKRPAAEIEKTSLPRDIKDSLIAMRGYIDSLSTQYAQVLNNDIETLKAQGNDEATAKSELLSIVVNNMGTYANRSYQAFNNKDWNKEVPEEVVLAARNLLVEQGTVNPDQVINTILKEGTAYDDMASFISESKLGAKDLAILTKRKQIAPEIRALLGEYKDPRVNFANSASKMSRLIYNDRFLKEVLASGNGVFLFDQESAPADATKKIAEVGSKTLSPLNGMYTYPEVEQAFKDALGKEEMGDLYRTIIKVNGLVKYGKTVIAPTTMARNFMSASLFTVANGHFNWSKLSKSFEVSGSYFSGIGDGIEYLKNLKKLGVVHDSPYAGEMIAYLQDANAEGILDQRDPSAILDTKDAALSLGKRVAQGFTKAYQFGDDFWKIVGFENEVMSFMENKGMSREEAEPLAAKRIRDTYPTYSLIGKIPQQLRRFPLVGTFVSFPAEIVRTQANMIKYLREDLADPDMRPAALKRITGMAMMSAGVYAAQAMAMSAFGVSEEEEEAIKLMAAPWAKNSNILVTGRDDEGRLEYLDLTHLDPYALMKRPLNALMRDQPIDDALIDASAEILKPFLGWDISTNTILEFISNEKSSGGEVYNDADTFINKSIATYMHFERGMGPSFLQNARRIEKAMGGEVSKSGKAYDMGDEMGALVGFRKTTFDPKTALHFKAYEFSEGKRQSTKLLTSVFRDPNDVSDSDIREAFGRASTARKETFNDMAALVNAAMASGLNATQAMTVLRSNGVTKKDARALIDGGASAWTMSDSTLKNSIVKSDILFGQQKSQEFKDRWTLIQQLLKEES